MLLFSAFPVEIIFWGLSMYLDIVRLVRHSVIGADCNDYHPEDSKGLGISVILLRFATVRFRARGNFLWTFDS